MATTTKPILAMTCLLILAACASVNSVPQEPNPYPIPVHIKYQVSSGANGGQPGDRVLRLVEPTHTGLYVGLQVAVSLLSGQFIGNTFSKEELKGKKIESLPEPSREKLVPGLAKALQEYFAELPSGSTPEQFTQPLIVEAKKWLLVYETLNEGQQQYELQYHVVFSKRPEDAGFFAKETSFYCQPEPKKMLLEEWVKNDHAAVRQVSDEYIAFCTSKVKEFIPNFFTKA